MEPNSPLPSAQAETAWSPPQRILLLTYDRADHIGPTVDHGVVGVPDDRGSITRARRVRVNDWVLVRISREAEFRASRPMRVTGRPFLQSEKDGLPDLLWQAEEEAGRVLYPLRIPVSFAGGPQTRVGCINWETLAALRLRGQGGYVLETPQQWGIKFNTNVLDIPHEVAALTALIERCGV